MYVGGRLAPLFDPAPAGRAAKRICGTAAETGKWLTKAKTPVGPPRVPPNVPPLRESIYSTPPVPVAVFHLRGWSAEWATDKEYAPYIEHGWGLWGWHHTKYPIRPRKPGGYLHFFTKDGREVFTQLVMHPGSHGRHMFANAANEVEATLPRIAAPWLEVWVREQEALAVQTPIIVGGKL